jgi:AAT family amino acid transporter/GABA permease
VSSTIGLALLISLVGVITARQPDRTQKPIPLASRP